MLTAPISSAPLSLPTAPPFPLMDGRPHSSGAGSARSNSWNSTPTAREGVPWIKFRVPPLLVMHSGKTLKPRAHRATNESSCDSESGRFDDIWNPPMKTERPSVLPPGSERGGGGGWAGEVYVSGALKEETAPPHRCTLVDTHVHGLAFSRSLSLPQTDHRDWPFPYPSGGTPEQCSLISGNSPQPPLRTPARQTGCSVQGSGGGAVLGKGTTSGGGRLVYASSSAPRSQAITRAEWQRSLARQETSRRRQLRAEGGAAAPKPQEPRGTGARAGHSLGSRACCPSARGMSFGFGWGPGPLGEKSPPPRVAHLPHFSQPGSGVSRSGQVSLGCRWLTPVILAGEEAEIRRVAVQSQPVK
jgi:hypothetical protein